MTTLIDPFTGRMRRTHNIGASKAIDSTVRAAGTINIYELLWGTLFVLTGVRAFGLPLPASQVAAMALVGIGLLRAPKRSLGKFAFIPALAIVLALYLVLVSYLSPYGGDYTRRLFRLALGCTLMMFFVSRRLDIRSVIAGAGLGSILNVPLFYAGLAPDNYGGLLTGFFTDKNVAGLSYAVFGLLGLGLLERKSFQYVWVVFIASCLWLTGSRTSIAAFLLGMIWMWATPRLSSGFRWIVAAASVWFVDWIQRYAQSGVFADRKGSDDFRELIGRLTEAKLQDTEWYGRGLGNAFVQISQTRRMFFHDSYATLQVEGGYLYLAAVVLVTILIGMRPFRRLAVSRSGAAAEAAILVLFVCATRLGEVMLATAWFLAMGAVMTSERDEDEGETFLSGEEADKSHDEFLQNYGTSFSRARGVVDERA